MFRKSTPLASLAAFAAAPAYAQEAGVPIFAPHDWQIWHQDAGSTLMANIEWFSAYTLWGMAIPVSLFVLALIAWVAVRFRHSANPVPNRVTHNTPLEIIWTVVPVIILVAIAIPSFQLLTEYERPEEKPTLTVKTIGYQWYWGYEYQDGEEGSELTFEQRLIGRTDGSVAQNEKARAELVSYGKDDARMYPNLLAVDNEMVVPVDTTVRLLVTAADVIHDWAMPALGAKMDAIPGRLNEFTFTAAREGLYYGQCSELCGRDHAFMPIGLRVVSKDLYDQWRAMAQTDIAAASKFIAEAQVAQAVARAKARDNQKLAAASVSPEQTPAKPVN